MGDHPAAHVQAKRGDLGLLNPYAVLAIAALAARPY